MRRTTICRSSRAVLLALVAGLLGVPGLGAQDTTRAAADPVRAQGADTVTAARVDTTVVDTAQLVEAPPPPPGPAETYETIFDRGRSRTAEVQDILRAYANQPYRPLRRGEFYAAGFLSERERLPWGLVLGATAVPAIPRLTQHTTATVFGQIAIQPPQGASYHVGDSLLIARIDRDLPSWGDVVVPVGVARVTDVQKSQLLGDVIMQFGRIHDGNLAMPLEPFKDAGEVRPVPVRRGLEAIVISQRDLHVLTNAQQILFLDRGRAEGVVPGDLFEIYRPASRELGGASEQPLIVVEIVHTREHSCSGLVLGITPPGVFPGPPARLIRKIPS